MTKIAAYPPPAPREVVDYPEVWDSKTGKFKPFSLDDVEMYKVLDSITLAAQGGFLDNERWVKQIFGEDRDLFDHFIDEIRNFDVCWRITDQWWIALQELAGGHGDEEGFVTCEEIADTLREYARETGQLPPATKLI